MGARFNTRAEAAYDPSSRNVLQAGHAACIVSPAIFRIFTSQVTHMSMDPTAAVAVLACPTLPRRATSASNLPPSPQAAEVPERVAAGTRRVTPGGATFMVPSGWSIVTGKNLVILEPPETDTHIAIVDSQAADASAAVAAGWAAYKPEAKRPLKLVTPRPAREGWDERQAFEYANSGSLSGCTRIRCSSRHPTRKE